jgi:intein/homing endonuclease
MSVTIVKNGTKVNGVGAKNNLEHVPNISEQYFGRMHNEIHGDHFRLDAGFLNQYNGKKPNFGFNGLGELVYYRTYSRLAADNTKETFLDTLTRVVEGCYEIQRQHCLRLHIPWDYQKALTSAHEMFERMWSFKFLPPGRGLWMMGTQFMWDRGSAALNNCGFVSTHDLMESDPAEPFCFLMDMSMLGVGVGFDTKGAGKITIHRPANIKKKYIIADSREGWVDSVRQLIQSYTNKVSEGELDFDYSAIRKDGETIKGFGGKASGSKILIELHGLIRNHLDARCGKSLDSVDITDLMNYIGRCVVAGNVRRCLPKGTLVHLKRGLVPIEQVVVGDLVLTADGYHSVSENVKQGVQRVITINSQLGSFRCTDRHRVAVMTGIGQYEWKRAYQLQTDDRLVFVDAVIQGTDTVLPGYGVSDESFVVPSLTTDVGWFIGAIHGDGYVYNGRKYKGRKHHGASVMIPINKDEYHDALVDKVNAGFAAFGYENIKVQPSDDNCVKYRVVSRKLAEYLHTNVKQSKAPLNVPEFIRMAKPAIRAAYVAGLMDTDGSTKNRPTTLLVSVYRDFVRQVQAVYSSLGIPTKMKLQAVATEKAQAKWVLSMAGDFAIVRFIDLIQPYAVKKIRQMEHASGHDFGYPSEWVKGNVDYGRSWSPQQRQMTYNRALLCEVKTSNLIPVRVDSVVDEGVEVETYDLSVPDRNEFVAEGLLVHNTAEIAFGDADDIKYASMKNYKKTLLASEVAAFENVTGNIWAEALKTSKDACPKARLSDFESTGIPNDRLAPAIETWNAMNHHRWASNNSIFANVGMDYKEISEQIAVNGEPGLIWLCNMRDYGRLTDGRQPGIDGRVMGSNPCVEQSLESYELCNLVETFPANHEDAEDYMRTLKFAYLYAKTVTLLPTHNPRTNQVTLRNRRIGLSQSGIVQAFSKFGRRVVIKDFCDAGYNEIRRWDEIYSEWLCIQKSIKVTSVKPSGTVSLVAGATPGIHHPEASTYWRRVRIAKDSILVKILSDAGYHIEPTISDPDRTIVVKFAVNDERVRPVEDVTIWEQMANAADYQRYWADNQVSCTVKFKYTERSEICRVLEAYEDQLKGISFLPHMGHGYAQAPYEPCKPEEVEAYNSKIKPADYSAYIMEAVGSTYCDNDSCVLQNGG